MSDDNRTDLLARYMLCLFERVESLERQVLQLRIDNVPDLKPRPRPAVEMPENTSKSIEVHGSTSTRLRRREAMVPLSKRDPAIAERWRKLAV